MPIARANGASSRADRVKGGKAGERSERTLDAGEHDETIRTAMGRRLAGAGIRQRRSQPTWVMSLQG
ncbi:hypothetical protein SAMN02746041_02377 [Desulfacinum hydrothermale DSM 13146]|uniref:Uncharacterized protein n=1 Tax=Desulfacinum hydrothermale DSM 13146 TaxID=1121390 RepID=A0A1W1XMR5_9BACT|nr:hypothetical protein [Desulfacinum hydrothermale]SMC25127.1 hypothetical protein SAMN02746041_02201 [Desulfacinum hydrothermale DSM 13146]SMC25595.1 hypothetical protein SAMN02746041_02377 [Desulfacinum hydrothermale DSM 13146]